VRERHADGERGRGGHIGNAELDVEQVGGHRPEDSDHDDREPVGSRPVDRRRELNRDRDHERDEAARDGQIGVDRMDEVVGDRLAECRAQQLDRPKIRRDPRNLRRPHTLDRASGRLISF